MGITHQSVVMDKSANRGTANFLSLLTLLFNGSESVTNRLQIGRKVLQYSVLVGVAEAVESLRDGTRHGGLRIGVGVQLDRISNG